MLRKDYNMNFKKKIMFSPFGALVYGASSCILKVNWHSIYDVVNITTAVRSLEVPGIHLGLGHGQL